METLVITITPRPDEPLLRVEDAMLQVLDLLRLHSEARRAVARPEEAFDWTLEKASAQSPFTVTARADPRDRGADITSYVREVNREFSTGLSELTERGVAPWWMDPDSLTLAAALFKRNENGIGVTEVRAAGIAPVRIDRQRATAGVKTISTVDILSVDAAAGEGEAWGEVRGAVAQVGTYYKQPALRLLTAEYGVVWCRLLPEVAGPFGHETTLEDIWKGKQLAVEGRLIYSAGGRRVRMIVSGIREVGEVPLVDLEAVRDRDFTDGLDPVEYLRRLHEGDLG